MSTTTTSVTTALGAITIREDGDPAAPALLLCQRFGGTSEDWDPRLIDRLAQTRRVIRFDMLGLGDSSGDMPEDVQGMAAVIPALLDALNLDTADLLGWSVGGYFAQAAALTWPERIKRLIIAGSGPGGPDAPPAHPRVAEIANQTSAGADEIAFLLFPETDEGRAAAKQHFEQIHLADQPRQRPESIKRQRAAILAWTKGENSAKPRLGKLNMPVLVANGIDDVMVPAENSFIIARDAPDAKLVIYPNSGHGFLFQYADDFADQVISFLEANDDAPIAARTSELA